MAGQPKRLVWLVDTFDKLRGFPAKVRQKLGFALYQAQICGKHESPKPFHGFEVPVWQVRADHRGGRTAPFMSCSSGPPSTSPMFQKKATSGISTRQRDIEIIRQRLKLARKLAANEEV